MTQCFTPCHSRNNTCIYLIFCFILVWKYWWSRFYMVLPSGNAVASSWLDLTSWREAGNCQKKVCQPLIRSQLLFNVREREVISLCQSRKSMYIMYTYVCSMPDIINDSEAPAHETWQTGCLKYFYALRTCIEKQCGLSKTSLFCILFSCQMLVIQNHYVKKNLRTLHR